MSHASYTMQHKDSTSFLHGIPTYRKAHRQVVYWPCWGPRREEPAREAPPRHADRWVQCTQPGNGCSLFKVFQPTQNV